MTDDPKTQVNVRLAKSLQDRVNDYRFRHRLASLNAAYEAVISAGLDAEPAAPASFQASVGVYNPAAPTGSISQAKRQIMAERGAEKPAAVVPYAGDLPRRGAVPKGAKK